MNCPKHDLPLSPMEIPNYVTCDKGCVCEIIGNKADDSLFGSDDEEKE